LILRKIIKIVATRCQILRLKCIKFDFGWGSAPDPTGGAYSAPPDPGSLQRSPRSPSWIYGGLLLREGREGRRGKGRGGEGGGKKEGEEKGGRGGKREGQPLQSTPPVKKSWIRAWAAYNRRRLHASVHCLHLQRRSRDADRNYTL